MGAVVYLVLMSLIAGILTGIVGMATLTLYPILLSVGVPPISANATITVAQVWAGLGTVLSSLRELRGHWQIAIRVAILDAAGGVLGALILIHSSTASFKNVVPVFIFIAGIMLLWPKQSQSSTSRATKLVQWISWISVFLVGMYSGYFGAAAGLLMLAVLSKVIHEPYVIYNAVRNFASFINNIVAATMFIFMLSIDWAVVIPLIIGLFIGGYLGPMIVRVIPSEYIRFAVGIFAIGFAIYLGIQTYL